MTAHATKRPSGVLSVTFERTGEPPKTALAEDGRRAMQVGVRLLLEARKLRPGDRLTVEVEG